MPNLPPEGFVRIESEGPDDLTIVLPDGTRITGDQIPIDKAEWILLPGEMPILKLEIPAVITANGCVVKSRKRSVNIQDFMEGRDENHHSG